MNSINLAQKKIKIIVVDDGELIRKTLKIELEAEEDIEVIAEAENGIIALQKIEKLNPDLAIIDLEMPGMDGIKAIEIISDRFPETKTLVFSSHQEREYINRAIVAGAKGYLLKGIPTKNLANAIRSIDQGYFQLGSGLLGKLSLSSRKQDHGYVESNYSKVAPQDSEKSSEIKNKIANQITRIVNLKTETVKDELLALMGKRLHELRNQQKEARLKIVRLQRIVYLVIVSQIFVLGLMFYVIGIQ